LIPQQMGDAPADLSRVIQGLVSGIGFIGAGAILKQGKRQVQGMTTAAGLWLTAAVGMAAGLGREASAILGTFLALFILSVLPRSFRRFGNRGAVPQDGMDSESKSVSGEAAQSSNSQGAATRARSPHES
jgi:putative Mg2+ transporter-C (MgtC) family protein